MLIVGKGPYRGRFHAIAMLLVKTGTRVGMCYVTAVEAWTCHACKHKNPPYVFPAGETDAMTKCASCGLDFVLEKV